MYLHKLPISRAQLIQTVLVRNLEAYRVVESQQGKGKRKNRKDGGSATGGSAYLHSYGHVAFLVFLLSVRFSFVFFLHTSRLDKRVRMRDKDGRGEFHVVVRADHRGFPLSGEEKEEIHNRF